MQTISSDILFEKANQGIHQQNLSFNKCNNNNDDDDNHDNDISDSDDDDDFIPPETDESDDEEVFKTASLSKEYERICKEAEQSVEQNVMTRIQQYSEEQRIYDLKEYSKQVVLISTSPLVFSVPYGHGVVLQRCFVVLSRDKTGVLKCQCSNPRIAVHLHHVQWVQTWINNHIEFNLTKYIKKVRHKYNYKNMQSFSQKPVNFSVTNWLQEIFQNEYKILNITKTLGPKIVGFLALACNPPVFDQRFPGFFPIGGVFNVVFDVG